MAAQPLESFMRAIARRTCRLVDGDGAAVLLKDGDELWRWSEDGARKIYSHVVCGSHRHRPFLWLRLSYSSAAAVRATREWSCIVLAQRSRGLGVAWERSGCVSVVCFGGGPRPEAS